MLQLIKNWRQKRKLKAVLEYCREFEENKGRREFKTFKIWATAKYLSVK